MAAELTSTVAAERPTPTRWALRWVPTSADHIVAAEKRLFSQLVKSDYVLERVDINSSQLGTSSCCNASDGLSRVINTVTFGSNLDCPTIVLVHGYGASQGFFFRNIDALARHFRVIAIDLLGWGASSRPDFTCKSTEEADAWFVESLEEWRQAKQLDKFILLGHSLGGYVAAKYALKYPTYIQHLILVSPVGFTSESEHMSERFAKFKNSWKGNVVSHLWESNFTPFKLVRGLGPWGPNMVQSYTARRFGTSSQGEPLTQEEMALFTNYVYHTIAAKPSGELCLKYILSFGAFAKKPLLESLSDWKVPTTFIYGTDDWMNYKGAIQARQSIAIPCEIIRVPKAGHYPFMDNPSAFHSAIEYVCHEFISSDSDVRPALPGGLIAV